MTPLLILGAGPAGLAAAEAASRNGQRVILIDENPEPGGQIWRGGAKRWQDRRAHALWDALKARPGVQMRFTTRVVAVAGPGQLLLVQGEQTQVQAWERVIVCSGARELLLPFPGWTLPGVTGAGAIQALIKAGMPVEGQRVVVAGSGPLLLAAADTVLKSGGTLAAIAEYRDTRALAAFAGKLALRHQAKLAQAIGLFARLRGVPFLHGAIVQAASGSDKLGAVQLLHKGRERIIDCDFLACGFGLVPAPESAALFGCAIDNGKVTVDAAQATSVAGVWAAGESTGIGGVDKALAEGRIAGLAAAGFTASRADVQARERALAFGALLASTFPAPAAMRKTCQPSTIVCRCEDVRAGELAAHASWRAAKLQTRVGMGPCQGRMCGAACTFLYGWEATSPRPPVFPVRAGALAAMSYENSVEK
ncbi:FAD/NAD(P)-binding oxidoreductase [Massilia sp. CF038]|uniref:NAD(P)/FAD-dependent oxidoreductase n=1 Tax=Massilia sp. CF038 TaxID=1881045 RepID=UPI0009166CE8|nr:FAD/NAD(P)-binding oxidoreductase [Massilia sp. CF038]SHG52214.1 Thioredoxin reductase [Massilia sp. CF038]